MKQTIKHLIYAVSLTSLMAFTSLAKAGDHAIILGCNDYQSRQFQSLQGAVKDAEAYELLFRRNGFHTVVLVDNPTCFEVNAAIRRKMKELKRGDTLTFVFGGHGRNHQKRSYLCFNDTEFDQKGRLVPSTALAVEDLLAVFDKVDLQNLTLILDACRVGSIFDRNNVPERFNLSGSIELNRNTMIVYSASPGQVSLEDGNRGCFSKYFVEGLSGYADVCNGNIDDLATYREAFDYAVKRLRENNIKQVPFAEGVWGDARNTPPIRSSLDNATKRHELAKRRLVTQQEHQLAQQELEHQKREVLELENRRLEVVQKNAELQREQERLKIQVSDEARLHRQRQHQLQMQQQRFRQETFRQGARIGLGIAMRYIR